MAKANSSPFPSGVWIENRSTRELERLVSEKEGEGKKQKEKEKEKKRESPEVAVGQSLIPVGRLSTFSTLFETIASR